MNIQSSSDYWVWHGQIDDYDYSAVIVRGELDNHQAAPPLEAVARLEHAIAGAAKLQAAALAAIQAVNPVAGLQRWSAIEFRIELDGALWVDLVEWEWDEYSRWAVRFDASDAPVEIRRRAFQLPPAKPGDKDRLIWSAS